MQRLVIALCAALLTGCTATPLYTASGVTPALSAWQQPACLFFCTIHLSLIRDDASTIGGGQATTGSKSTSSSSGGNTVGGGG